MDQTVTVDIGTTSVKLGLYGSDGVCIETARYDTPTMTDDWGEVYDSDALLGIVETFIAGLEDGARAGVERIAVGGVGESGGLVGSDLRLRSPMILWHDQRGAPVIDRLTPEQRCFVYQRAGLPANANYALSKIRWALDRAGNDGDTLWLNVSEFIAARLSGDRWAEPSLASRTLALDLRNGGWSSELCALFGVDAAVLPPLRAASEGRPILPDVAARLGVSGGVLVHVVGHDHMVGAVGAGLAPGELLNSTGTTEGLLALSEAPRLDDAAAAAKLANGIACDGRAYTVFVSIPTGGAVFRTLQHMLGISVSALVECLDVLTGRYLAGEIDLARAPVIVPHFSGSPPPEKSAAARAAIVNLRADVRAEDIVFGAFLGMAWQFRKVVALFPERPAAIKVIGPASRNPLWLHLKADALAIDLSVSQESEVVSLGAQALASGTGRDWEAVNPFDVSADLARHARILDWHQDATVALRRAGEVDW